jgi:hypothetical protein
MFRLAMPGTSSFESSIRSIILKVRGIENQNVVQEQVELLPVRRDAHVIASVERRPRFLGQIHRADDLLLRKIDYGKLWRPDLEAVDFLVGHLNQQIDQPSPGVRNPGVEAHARTAMIEYE